MDPQGTGAVVLAGYIGATSLSGVPIEEQRLVFYGAGSAGVGVAKQLVEFYTRRGLSEQQAKEKDAATLEIFPQFENMADEIMVSRPRCIDRIRSLD